ncbi:hypothetical protein QIW31_01020 [Francisellaceae bacterium CB299]|jgi:hypothetical protein
MSERNKLREKQIIIGMGVVGMSVAFIILIASWFYIAYLGEDSVLTRLNVLSNSLILPVILIVGLVINVGRKRFDASEAVRDGCNDDSIRIHQSILTNTTEQSLIFIMFLLFFTFKLDIGHLYMVYVYTLVFLLGRAVFILGYLIRPIYRATGFAMNISSAFMIICMMMFA